MITDAKERAIILISKFREKALSENNCFSIREKESKGECFRHFFIDKVGVATYIYGIHGWNNKVHGEIENKPALVAIVSHGNIFIVDTFFFNIWACDNLPLPPNVFILYEYTKKMNKIIQESVFKNFYASLPIEEVEESSMIKTARNCLLAGKGVAHEPPTIFSCQDIANSLSHFISLEKEAIKRLEKERDEWIYIKSKEQKVLELILADKVAEPWEKEIASGLANIDAKYVTVDFTCGEKVANAKVCPKRILKNLVEQSSFSTYDFQSSKKAYELFAELGASSRWNNENALRCKNINKITYGRKVLYENNNSYNA